MDDQIKPDPFPEIPTSINPVEAREALSKAKSMREWRVIENTIKGIFGGELPEWWQAEIIDSGYADGVKYSWNTTEYDG